MFPIEISEASGFGHTQNPARHSLKQPPVGGPALSRRVGEDNLQKHLPAWTILWFLSQFSNKCKVHRRFQWTAQYALSLWFQGHFIQFLVHLGNGNPVYRARCTQRFSIANCHVIAEELQKTRMPLKSKWLDVLQSFLQTYLLTSWLAGHSSCLYVTFTFAPLFFTTREQDTSIFWMFCVIFVLMEPLPQCFLNHSGFQ